MSQNNAAIEFRVGPDGEWRCIPPSQAAALLRFLAANRHRCVVWDEMYQALGKSSEVPRCLNTLRKKKWQIPITCEKVPNASGRGKHGLYRLADEVEVREPALRPVAEDGR